MKKIILSFLIFLFFISPSLAQDNSKVISNVENVLFGFQYTDEDDSTRIDRIEKSIYGNSNSGNINQRIEKLKKDLSANLIGQEIKPKADTFADEDYYDDVTADSNIQYPAVDELEQSIFGKVQSKKDIKSRLADLELKCFNKKYDDDLATRVDRLKAEVKPKSFTDNKIVQSSNNFYDGEVDKLQSNYHLDRYDSQADFDYEKYNSKHNFLSFGKKNISNLEVAILKHSYPEDSMPSRLARLESSIFGTIFSEDDDNTRLERISSAYNAQKSASKYDSNKFSVNMATAMQIGTIILMVLACIL